MILITSPIKIFIFGGIISSLYIYVDQFMRSCGFLVLHRGTTVTQKIGDNDS